MLLMRDARLSSSPSISLPPSSVFDEHEEIKGWTSASSHPTESSLSGGAKGKRRRVGWTVDRREAVGEESPTLVASKKRARKADATQKMARNTAGSIDSRSGRAAGKTDRKEARAPTRTRSDPLPSLLSRAVTPPPTPATSKGGLDRPQSAMRHKSANKYSLGGDEPMLILTSRCQMPDREQSPNAELSGLRLPCSSPGPDTGMDPDAFSPEQTALRRMSTYALRARASLPRSSFYERHKEEESSPTPESRRRAALVRYQ